MSCETRKQGPTHPHRIQEGKKKENTKEENFSDAASLGESMHTEDDSVEALQLTLQNAFAVLGRKPAIVSGFSDEDKYRSHIRKLEAELDGTKVELYETRKSLSLASTDLEKMTAHVLRLKKEMQGLVEQKNRDASELECALRDLADCRKKERDLVNENSETKTALVRNERMFQKTLEADKIQIDNLKSHLADLESSRNTLTQQLSEARASLECGKASFSALESKSNRTKIKHEGYQAGILLFCTSVSSCLVMDRFYWRWWTRTLQRRLTKSEFEIRSSESQRQDLTLCVNEKELEIKKLQAEVDGYEARRRNAVSVGCNATRSVSNKSVSTVDSASRQIGPLFSGKGPSRELDEIAKLRWEIDRQHREFAKQMEDRSSVISFLEMEVGRLSEEIDNEKKQRIDVELSRESLLKELAIVQGVLRKQSSSMRELNEDYNKVEETASRRCEFQLTAAAEDFLKMKSKTTTAIMLKNQERIVRPFFSLWLKLVFLRRLKKTDVASQTKGRNPVATMSMIATAFSSNHDHSIASRFLAKWKEHSQICKQETLARERRERLRHNSSQTTHPLTSTSSQTEDGECTLDLIEKRCDKLRMAHHYEIAFYSRGISLQKDFLNRKAKGLGLCLKYWFKWIRYLDSKRCHLDSNFGNELMNYRLHVAGASRDVESTVFLLEQSNLKIKEFQDSVDELREALAESNSINQLLTAQNKSLRVEISRLK